MSEAVRRFIPLLDEVAQDFCHMMQTKVEREGRGERGKRSLTINPSPDLFRFALEGPRPSKDICDLCSRGSNMGSDGGAAPLIPRVFYSWLTLNWWGGGRSTSPPAYISFFPSKTRSLQLSHKG